MDSSHWLSLATIPGKHRESKKAQLGLSPNHCPLAGLRPEGCARPFDWQRPGDSWRRGIVRGVCEERGMIQEICPELPIFTHTALAEGERAGGIDDIRFRISG